MTSTQVKLQQLDQQRKDIETQISALNKELKYYEDKNYNKSLVDEEGFPRADLDFGELTTYKNLKRKFNELNNDYKGLMVEIEKSLGDLHEEYRESGQAQRDLEEYEKNIEIMKKTEAAEKAKKEFDEDMNDENINTEIKKNILIPFAYINEVVDQSPAFQAGVKLNDLIVSFGPVNHYNHKELQFLIETVKSNVNKEIPVQVLRKNNKIQQSEQFYYKNENYQLVHLTLTPRTWSGQGVLGCRFKVV
ncbi:hypothetical protein ABPG74_014234 [Tetrahymena malaccensis]